MQLTTEQISTINETLVLNGLVYDDVKMELLDHIATEIEQVMDDKEIQFEEALKTAFSNWEGQLHASTSFWIRGDKSVPKIIIQKSLQMVKRIFLMAFGFGIVSAALATLLFKSYPQHEVVLILNAVLQVAGGIGILLFIYFQYRLWQSKQKSTYSFLFNRNGIIQIINLAAIATGIFEFKGYTTFTDYHFMSALLPIIFLLVPFFYLNVAFQHLRFEKKLKLSCR
jgi:hypothetical protein